MVDSFDEKIKTCFISHANCLDDANFLKQLILDKFNCDVLITDLGPVIGSHSGPGTIALFFISKNSNRA